MARSLKALGLVKAPQILPEGRYEAELVDTELIDTAQGEAVKWRFEVVLPDDPERYTVTGLTPDSLELGSRTCIYAEILLKRPLEEGEQIEWGKLRGCRATIQVNHRKRNKKQRTPIPTVTAIYPLDSPELPDKSHVGEQKL